MVLLLPLVSFLIGYFGVEYLQKIRPFMAMLLAKVLIPLIIIYNMVFYQEGSIWLMLFSFIASFLLYLFVYYRTKDKLVSLCSSYLNMAWLGFPFAFAIFGAQASSPMVALYVGGSIFGNICAVTVLSAEKQSAMEILRKLTFSPPILALLVAGFLSLWNVSHFQQNAMIQSLYILDKWLMTFTGMCILGMWLSQVKIHLSDLIESLKLALIKFLFGLVCCAVAYLLLPIPHELVIIALMSMFFLLPPAANIVALETHYSGTGVSAQYIAAGTIVSYMTIGLFAMVYHGLIV